MHRSVPERKPLNATCALFLPYPRQNPLTQREIEIEHIDKTISEDSVKFHEQPPEEDGLPPKVPIPVDENKISVQLVRSSSKPDLIVGYQIKTNNTMSTFRLNHALKASDEEVSAAQVVAQQVMGFPSNDGKQVLILTGQCSNASLCSCPVCMGAAKYKGMYPRWWWELRAKKTGQVCYPVFEEPVLREGENSCSKTHENYMLDIGEGMYNMSAKYLRAANLNSGSSFYKALLEAHVKKQDLGPMHTGQGCVTHGTKEVVSMCNAQDEKGPFWKRVVKCHEHAKVKVTELKSSPEYKQLHKESVGYHKRTKKLIDDAEKAKEDATPKERSIIQQTCVSKTKHIKKNASNMPRNHVMARLPSRSRVTTR